VAIRVNQTLIRPASSVRIPLVVRQAGALSLVISWSAYSIQATALIKARILAKSVNACFNKQAFRVTATARCKQRENLKYQS